MTTILSIFSTRGGGGQKTIYTERQVYTPGESSAYHSVISHYHWTKVGGPNESMVSFVSRRYMRVVNGILVVCLSGYLPLHSVYILVIKV